MKDLKIGALTEDGAGVVIHKHGLSNAAAAEQWMRKYTQDSLYTYADPWGGYYYETGGTEDFESADVKIAAFFAAPDAGRITRCIDEHRVTHLGRELDVLVTSMGRDGKPASFMTYTAECSLPCRLTPEDGYVVWHLVVEQIEAKLKGEQDV